VIRKIHLLALIPKGKFTLSEISDDIAKQLMLADTASNSLLALLAGHQSPCAASQGGIQLR
jgi:hypothetical protein